MLQSGVVEKIAAAYQAGNLKAVEKQCQKFLRKNPDAFELWNFLGLAYLQSHRFNKAIDAFSRASKLRDDDAGILNNLGMSFFHKGQFADAANCLSRAAALDANPAYTKHLALALAADGRDDEADAQYREYLGRAPGAAAALDYGMFLRRCARYEEAETQLLQAARLAPQAELPASELAQLYADWLRFDRLYEAFERFAAMSDNPTNFSAYLFQLNNHPTLSPEQVFAEYRRYNDRFSAPAAERLRHEHRARPAGEKLRVGYISADMHSAHASSRFLMPLLEHHDRSEIEIYLYAIDSSDIAGLIRQARGTDRAAALQARLQEDQADPGRARYRALADRFSDVSQLSDSELVNRIRRDKLDVLVEMSGHTQGERLRALSHKPAPVIVSWLGYGYTTGLDAIDYFLGDSEFTPAGEDHLYSESVMRLSRPPFAYQPPEDMPDVGPLPAASNGYVTFGSFSRAIRFNDRVLACWSELLKGVPGSRLVLNTAHFQVEKNREIFFDRFARYGIDRDRLDLKCTRAPVTWEEYGNIDVALDPFPHNAGTTTFDALWLGVPVLSLAGRVSTQRLGAMILRHLDLDDWVVPSEAEYVARGSALAGRVEALATLRAGLRQRLQASVFMDYRGLAAAFEAAYREMDRRRG